MNKYVKLLSSTISSVSCDISRLDRAGKTNVYTVVGTLRFDRVTGSLHVSWNDECTLPLLERLHYVSWFVKVLFKL